MAERTRHQHDGDDGDGDDRRAGDGGSSTRRRKRSRSRDSVDAHYRRHSRSDRGTSDRRSRSHSRSREGASRVRRRDVSPPHTRSTGGIPPASTAVVDRSAYVPTHASSRARHWFAKEYDPVQIGSIDGTDSTPHDKALVRALHARFDASRDPKIAGDPYKTLFVARLAFTTTEDVLTAYFAHFGAITRARIVRDVVTQQSRGYAFVEFAHARDFERAYREAHRHVLDGRTILVDYERSRVMPGWKPRRLGGGLGGRKESGQLRFGGRDHPFKPPARLKFGT